MPLFSQNGIITNKQAKIPVIITEAGPSIYQHPNPQELKKFSGQALIDTGATLTCITGNVIQALDLRPNGKILISGTTGTKPANTYRINIYIPMINDDPEVQNGMLHSLGANAVAISNEVGFEMLMGMDIIQQCTLIINKNQFTLIHGQEIHRSTHRQSQRQETQAKQEKTTMQQGRQEERPMRTEHISNPVLEYPAIGGTPEADGSHFIAVENKEGTFLQMRLVNSGPYAGVGSFIMKYHVPSHEGATKFTDLRSLASIFLNLEETNRYWFYRCLPNGEAKLLNPTEIIARMNPNIR